MANRAAEIIEHLGGTSVLSRSLGHRWPTTVQGWKTRGIIPIDQAPAVIEAAHRLKKPLSHADFFPDVEPSWLRCDGASAQGDVA